MDDEVNPVDGAELVDRPLVKTWAQWALVWLTFFPLVGVLVSIQFHNPEFLGGTSWLTFGRLRPVHTNGVIFGSFTTAFIGLLYYFVPRLCGTPVYNVEWLHEVAPTNSHDRRECSVPNNLNCQMSIERLHQFCHSLATAVPEKCQKPSKRGLSNDVDIAKRSAYPSSSSKTKGFAFGLAHTFLSTIKRGISSKITQLRGLNCPQASWSKTLLCF